MARKVDRRRVMHVYAKSCKVGSSNNVLGAAEDIRKGDDGATTIQLGGDAELENFEFGGKDIGKEIEDENDSQESDLHDSDYSFHSDEFEEPEEKDLDEEDPEEEGPEGKDQQASVEEETRVVGKEIEINFEHEDFDIDDYDDIQSCSSIDEKKLDPTRPKYYDFNSKTDMREPEFKIGMKFRNFQ